MNPALSVVIPLYGGRDLLTDTFAALADGTEVDYEVIVIDNASPDDAAAWIESNVPEARVHRNTTNLGFGVACNQGALFATAASVCFLNSDARVEPGWFEALDGALAAVPRSAAAVPRYVEADGMLQEAGAVVDGRGEGVLFGHRDPADAPQHGFRRVVEYGSAACMLVRRDVFHEVGGFDPAFGLAYYEDSDFGQRLAEAGYRVVYAPAARVEHIRGASPRPNGLDELRDRNRSLLFGRRPDLAKRPEYADLGVYPDRITGLRDLLCGDRLLALVSSVPEPTSPNGVAIAEIATSWPDARVSIVSIEPVPTGDDRWSRLGVEVATTDGDATVWLRRRIGQVTIAWTFGANAAEAFDAPLRAMQPQALRVHQPDADEPDTWSAVADLLARSGGSPQALLAAAGWPPP